MNNQTILSSLKARGLQAWQASFVASFLEANSAAFQILTGPSATGKTYSSAMIVAELVARGAKRILVLAPASLCRLWGDLINNAESDITVVLVTRQVYREMEAAVPIGQSPWDVKGVFILGQDLAKQSDFVTSLSAVTWDLVIVDEAHRMASPQRGALLDRLMAENVIQRLLLLTATPLPTLENWVHPSPGQRAHFPVPLLVTNWSGVLRDWNGSPIIRPRVDLEVVSYTRGADEIQFLSRFLGLIPALVVGMPSGLERFLMRDLTQRAASSSFTIEQSLQRLKYRLKSELQYAAETEIGLSNANTSQSEPDTDLDEDELPDSYKSCWTNRASALSIVEQLLEALDRVTSDEKLNATKRLIRLIMDSRSDHTPRICVFSMYADTLSYLYSATDDLGIQVYKATGVDSFAERQATIQGFLEQGGLLVSTDAGLEGATLQEVAHVIHYDLPSNPKILDQRLGRFDRYGREVPCTMYLLRDESGAMPVEFPPTDSIISEHRSRMLSGGSGTGEE